VEYIKKIKKFSCEYFASLLWGSRGQSTGRRIRSTSECLSTATTLPTD